MTMLDATVVVLTVLAAGLFLTARHRGASRADLPGSLQHVGFALTSLAAALLLSGPPTWLALLVLVPAAGSFAAAGVGRAFEELTHAALVEHHGGPVLGRSRAAVPGVTAAVAALGAGLVVHLGPVDPSWSPLVLVTTVVPFVIAGVARRGSDRRQRSATAGYEHELAFWAWELGEDELTALEVRLENARLARALGLAPLLVGEPARPRPDAHRAAGARASGR
ncbi:hypothetical protein [Microlunatus aurantiacus]